MYALAGCLTFSEASDALINLIKANAITRRPALVRLFQLANKSAHAKQVDVLAHRLTRLSKNQPALRVRINAVLSQLLPYVTAATKRKIVQIWKTDTLLDSKRRWLKAATDDHRFLNVNEIWLYWLQSRNNEAAQLVASHASSKFLRGTLSDLLENCDRGWIIGRAMIRAGRVPPDLLKDLKRKFPATYAYVCAKKKMSISHRDALALVVGAKDSDDRGLILWALGQLGMWQTLEEIYELGPDIAKHDQEFFLKRHGIKLDKLENRTLLNPK